MKKVRRGFREPEVGRQSAVGRESRGQSICC